MLADWKALLVGQRQSVVDRTVVSVLQDRASTGGSRPSLVLCDDGQQYWMKTLQNPQSPRVPINDFVVGRLGQLIDAPVCDVARLELPPEFDGDRLSDGRVLQAGVAHGSRNVPDAVFERRMHHRKKDDNRLRHCGLYALHDLCWGSDSQWLYCSSLDMTTYSHDHGHYFPGGPNWTVERLQRTTADSHPLPFATDGLSADAMQRCADRVRELTRDDLARVMLDVPLSWPVTDDELAELGWFLEQRKVGVSRRLDEIADALKERERGAT